MMPLCPIKRCNDFTPFSPALTRQRLSSPPRATFVRVPRRNLIVRCAIHSSAPASSPTRPLKTIASARRIHLPRYSVRGKIPIALAAPQAHHLTRFRALALFGRRPYHRVDSHHMPATEKLHKTDRPKGSIRGSLPEAPADN